MIKTLSIINLIIILSISQALSAEDLSGTNLSCSTDYGTNFYVFKKNNYKQITIDTEYPFEEKCLNCEKEEENKEYHTTPNYFYLDFIRYKAQTLFYGDYRINRKTLILEEIDNMFDKFSGGNEVDIAYENLGQCKLIKNLKKSIKSLRQKKLDEYDINSEGNKF